MEVLVIDFDGFIELCEIMDEEDFYYRMMFILQMEGIYIFSIKYKGFYILGIVV